MLQSRKTNLSLTKDNKLYLSHKSHNNQVMANQCFRNHHSMECILHRELWDHLNSNFKVNTHLNSICNLNLNFLKECIHNLNRHSINNLTKYFNLRCQECNILNKINISDNDEINLLLYIQYYVVFFVI